MTTLAIFPLALFLSGGTPVPPADCPTFTSQHATCATPSLTSSDTTEFNRDALTRFVGQWEGELRVHAERGTSVSYVTASNELVNNGNAVLILFQGFAYANPIDGASFLTLNQQTNALTGSWFDTFSCSTISLSNQPSHTISHTPATLNNHTLSQGTPIPTLTLSGIALTDQRVIHQITTFESDTRLLIQLVAFDDENNQVPLLSMDLVKLPSGEESMAATLRQDMHLLAQLQLGNNSTLLQRTISPVGVQITSVDAAAE